MTIINGFKLDYQRREPRIIRQDAATEQKIKALKLGARRER